VLNPFIDSRAYPAGVIRYAVTAVYEGSQYDQPIESAPVYSNPLTISARYFTVSGRVVLQGNPISSAVVTLTSVEPNEYDPPPFTTTENGLFSLSAFSGEYTLTVYYEGVDNQGIPFLPYVCNIVVDIANVEIEDDIEIYSHQYIVNEGWENGSSDWTTSNSMEGTAPNQWHVGTAIANGGTHSMYISNDNGTSFAYSERGHRCTSYFYREVSIPANALSVTLSFDVHCVGQYGFGTGSYMDYVSVHLQPLSEPAPVATISEPPATYQLGRYANVTSWTRQTFTIDPIYFGSTMRLVFAWSNDALGLQGDGTPGAIDNIKLLALLNNEPPAPATLVSPLVGGTTSSDNRTLTWEAGIGSTPTGYDVYLGVDNPPTTKVVDNQNVLTYLLPTTLSNFTTYYWRVHPRHNAYGDAEIDTCPVWAFTNVNAPVAEVGISDSNLTTNHYLDRPSRGWLPDNGFYYNSITQSIYRASDFGAIPSGRITHIQYRYHRGTGDLPAPYDIYMANASKPNGFTSTSDWLPYEAFTLVKSGFALAEQNLVEGLNEIWIELNEPYLYQGEDLVILTYKASTASYNMTDGFYQTPVVAGSNISLARAEDNVAYTGDGHYNIADPTAGSGGDIQLLQYKPQMRFVFATVANGADLAISSFTVPAFIPSAENMQITVINNGSVPATADGYSVDIYLVDETDTFLYTIPATTEIPAVGNYVFSTATYEIAPAIFNAWSFNNPTGGLITLKAVVTITNDIIDTNNSLTASITLRPTFDLSLCSDLPAAFAENMKMQIIVENNGWVDVDIADYELEIYVNGNTTPTVIASTAAIPIGETTIISLAPSEIAGLVVPSSNTIRVNVKNLTATAETTLDNNSAEGSIFALLHCAEVGILGSSYFTRLPFSLFHCDSVGQSIYTAEEMGISSGMITHINYKARIPNLNTSPQPPPNPFTVTVYLANTAAGRDPFDGSNWEPMAAFTMVANDYPLNIHSIGDHEVWIALEEPFYYSGGDLIVMTYKNHAGYYSAQHGFYGTVGEVEVSMIQVSDAAGANFWPDHTIGVGTPVLFKPQTRFGVITAGWGYVSGLITSEDSVAIAGVRVAVEGSETCAITGDDGRYSLLVQTSSTANLIFSKSGLITQTKAINTLNWSNASGMQSAEYNLTMVGEVTGRVVVSGRVVRQGVAAVGAIVTMLNEDDPTNSPEPQTTAELGTFEFIVTPSTYSLTIQYQNYPLFTHGEVEVTNVDLELGDIDITTLSDEDIVVPTVTALRGNYPNPFNPTTTIAFDIARSGHVVIEIYNIKGQKVRVLADGVYDVGRHNIVWNGDDAAGRSVGSGVYFYRMSTQGYQSIRKMLLLK